MIRRVPVFCLLKSVGGAGLVLSVWLLGAINTAQAQAIRYQGSWYWTSQKFAKVPMTNTSTLNILGPSRARYCYNTLCYTVTYKMVRKGLISFSTDGANYFEFMDPGYGSYVTGRFWSKVFPRSALPEAVVTMRSY